MLTQHISVGEVFSSVLLCLVVMLVLVGNCLVVAAVATSRKLRTVTNMFIVNLACADLLLGVLVLPFSAAIEILDTWIFGHVWCQVWLAVDVWLCTASILNLCCISLDRYLAITRPVQYPGIMSAKRVKMFIVGIWVFSFIVCCPPLIGWNSMHDGNDDDIIVEELSNVTATYTVIAATEVPVLNYLSIVSTPDETYGNVSVLKISQQHNTTHEITKCGLTNSRGYRIYAALGSFFIPMLVMVFFYVQIYRAAVRTILAYERGELKSKCSDKDSSNGSKSNNSVTLRVHRGGGSVNSHTNSRHTYSSHSPVRKTRSTDTNFVTMNDSSFDDEDNIMEHLPHNAISLSHGKGHDRQNSKRCVGRLCEQSTCSRFSFKDGSHFTSSGGYRRNENSLPLDDGFDKKHGSSFRTCHNRHFQQPSQSLDNGNRLSLSRHPSAYGDKKPRRNMFSVNRATHAAKIHMQKFNREKKAAKTLAIIVGAFIFCWLPFFTIYLVGAFCDSCIPAILFSVAFWLGYCNSAMNPCVYALFSKDFRLAFRKLLLCRVWHRSRNIRLHMSALHAIQLHVQPRHHTQNLT